MVKKPSSQSSITNIRDDAKATSKLYNQMWSITKHAPLFLKRPKMVGTGKQRKRATYTNKRGEEVPISQKVNHCFRRYPVRVLLSAAAANVAQTLEAESAMMKTDVKGEANCSGALPVLTKGAEKALEHAFVAYCQTIYEAALDIRAEMNVHQKVTAGCMQAAANIVNDIISTSTGVVPGVLVLNKSKRKKIKKKADAAPTSSDVADVAAPGDDKED